MPGRYDDWPPGFPLLQEEMDAQAKLHAPGGAKALRELWYEIAQTTIAPNRPGTRIVVTPQEFNAWRRRMLDQGNTDAALGEAFRRFAQAAARGQANVRGRDAFRVFVATAHKYLPNHQGATAPRRRPKRY